MSSRVENSELYKRYVQFKGELHVALGGARADEKSSLGQVGKEMIELAKWPCKFARGGCRNGDRCRYSHLVASERLSNVSRAAGRRLPVDEIDHHLNENFLWFAGTKKQSNSMSKGKFNDEDF